MAHGLPVSLAGTILRQAEIAVGNATKRLFTEPLGDSRVWLGAPTANHKKGSINTGLILIGCGAVTITLTGNPADTNTITISDGAVSKTYEFDNNATITGGNILVTIGASATASVLNLIAAIELQYTNQVQVLRAQKDLGGDIANLRHVESISRVGANITLGNINAQGSTPLDPTDAKGYFDPITPADLLYVTAFNVNDAVEVRVYR